MSTVAQAGAIAVKVIHTTPLFLITTAKRDPNQWIFPKGHIEPGESAEEAARRELREETGVDADPVARVGVLEFQSNDELVRVEYYLFRYLREVAPGEGRERRWCLYDEALGLLSHQDARSLLAKAVKLLPNS